MLIIRSGRLIIPLVVVNILLLGTAKLLMQLPVKFDFTFYHDMLGISLVAMIVVISVHITNSLLKARLITRKIHCVAVADLTMVCFSLILTYLALPLLALPQSPNLVMTLFIELLLMLGVPILGVIVGAPFFRGAHRLKDHNAGLVNGLALYHDKSLLFSSKNKIVALCILKLMSRQTAPSESTIRRQNFRRRDSNSTEESDDGLYSYSYLTSLWSNVPDFSIEFSVENGLTSIKLFTLSMNSDAGRAVKVAEEKAEKLKSILQTRFNTKIEFLQGHRLWDAYGLIFGRYSSYITQTQPRLIKVGGKEEGEERYIAVSVLRGTVEPNTMTQGSLSQVEQFISAFAKERLTASMAIHLEAINPPSMGSESKLIERARNESDTKVLLELGEKKKELDEGNDAQLSEYWRISAYIVYRGMTISETKLSQEKGDACIEAIYSSSRGRAECEKLKGRDITKHMVNLLFRQEIGATVAKASSRLAATLTLLPEQHLAGIQEGAVPAYTVPADEELESGEIVIGTIMDGENEICPMRMKLEDLMLHTVIFGETGFGKTRLIMGMLQALSDYDIAWTIIEMKGEYKPLVKVMDDVVYLRPVSKLAPLKINLFDPQMEKADVHAKKIFTILKETFSTLFTDQSRELSAQMERVFYETLVSYITSQATSSYNHQSSDKSDNKHIATTQKAASRTPNHVRNWQHFSEWLESYAKRCGRTSMPQINSTIQALLNRLYSFTRTPLNEVFNHDGGNVNFNDLVKRKAIIDLSEIKTNGTAEDLRLISNIIIKYIATAAQQRGIQEDLKHILIIDDALDIVPEILTKRTTAETSITEQMVLLLRAMGQGVIISTQRPNISQNIIANAATKIFLRTTVDSEKAAKWLNLNEEQTNYLKTMPKMEAIITTPSHSKPMRIRTLQIRSPKVDNQDIIINNTINYPVIYEELDEPNSFLTNNNATTREAVMTRTSHSDVARLRTTAEEAYQAGNYKESLRTYIKAIEIMKEQEEKDEIETAHANTPDSKPPDH